MTSGMTRLQSDRWFFKWREVARTGRTQREQSLQAIEAEFELENDEFETAREKALRILQVTP